MHCQFHLLPALVVEVEQHAVSGMAKVATGRIGFKHHFKITCIISNPLPASVVDVE